MATTQARPTGQSGTIGQTQGGGGTRVERHLLGQRFTPQRVRETLLSREVWRPFPRWEDRAGWAVLPEDVRRRAIAQAEQHLGASWPDLPATVFLEFRRTGNRSHFEARHFPRRTMLAQLALGECIEGKGRFLDDIVNGVWAICEESFWGVSAHSYSPTFPDTGLPDTAYRVVDLFAAETAALLAWTHYLVGDQLARELPVVLDRITREVEERILEPYRNVDDWRWMGKSRWPVNNWNPWIHSNILAANLLLERDPAKRTATVDRIVTWLDAWLDGYDEDGGCDEGPGYWSRAGASLLDCLEWFLSASNGALNAYDVPLVQEIGRFIYRVHVGGPWYVNFADASALAAPTGNLVYRYGKRIGDARLMRHGAYIHKAQPGEEDRAGRTSIGRALPALFIEEELRGADAAPPLVREAWLGGIQVLTAREREGSADGLFLAAKGGHNAESHNHNDVGSFIVAVDGHPALIDVGVETYTKQTFSPETRYTIWTMQSLYHNLPAIDGRGQSAGREFAARDVSAQVDDAQAALRLDIAAAYPAELGVERWLREVRLERAGGTAPAQVVLEEEYTLRGGALDGVALHLMSSGAVDVREPGTLVCQTPTRPLVVRYAAEQFAPQVEEIQVEDARLKPVWGNRVYRVVLTVRDPQPTGRWTITMSA